MTIDEIIHGLILLVIAVAVLSIVSMGLKAMGFGSKGGALNSPDKAFYYYLDAARKSGVEEGFMSRFNTRASFGDLLSDTIKSWSVDDIRRMFEEAVADKRR